MDDPHAPGRTHRSMSRRRCLALGAGAMAGLAWRATEASAGDAPRDGRIRSLRLLTAVPLAQMRAYYEGVLGLPARDAAAGELVITAGATEITFVQSGPEHGLPWTHVAFNIPENKVLLARQWLLERGPVAPRPPRAGRLAGYTDVAEFANWNAHAVFFWDPAGNLLECIGRHDLPNAAPGPFTSADFLCASEIGLMSDDVPALADGLQSVLDLPAYRGAGPTFRPMGDEHGLLIVFPRGRTWPQPDGSERPTDIYPTDVGLRGPRPVEHVVGGHPYRIEVV